MEKSKIWVVGLIGLLLVIGLALTSCGSKCVDGGNCQIGPSYSTEILCGMDSCAAVAEFNRVQRENQAIYDAWVAAGDETAPINYVRANDVKCNCD